MYGPRRQFAYIFRFSAVLLRQILRPVGGHVAHPIKNALMNMDAVWNQPSASEINRDTSLPLRGRLPRDGHRIKKMLWPQFAHPPEAVQRFMQLSPGIWLDVRNLS